MFQSERLEKLAKERSFYRSHPEDEFLQAKKFKSIAKAVLIESKEIIVPTSEELELIEWAEIINNCNR